jgi:cobalamin biosynthesis protein CobT
MHPNGFIMSNLIDLKERRNKKLKEMVEEANAEYSDFDTGWEELVDVTLDSHEMEIDRLKVYQKQLYITIEDNIKDIAALQATVATLLNVIKDLKD